MPISRSREVISKPSTNETLEAKEPLLDPSTPPKPDAEMPAPASPSSFSGGPPAAAPRRRSPRLASVSPTTAETVTSRKRKARVSVPPDEGKARVLEERGSMNLRSGTRIAKRGVVSGKEEGAEVDLMGRLDFGATVVEEKSRDIGVSRLEEDDEAGKSKMEGNEKYEEEKQDAETDLRLGSGIAEFEGGARFLEESRLMSLRSGTRKRGAVLVKEKGAEVESREGLDSGAVVLEEKLGSMGASSSRWDEDDEDRKSEEEGHEEEGNEKQEINTELRLGCGTPKLEVRIQKNDVDVEFDRQVKLMLESIPEYQMYKEERKLYEAKGKGKLVLDADYAEKNVVIDEEEKGKGKLVIEEDDESSNQEQIVVDEVQVSRQGVGEGSGTHRRARRPRAETAVDIRREADRKRALEVAPNFAFYKAEESSGEEDDTEDLEINADKEEEWPGPFSTAMKLIRDREQILVARESSSSSKKTDDTGVEVKWAPSKDHNVKPLGKSVPSLHDLCMKVLSENAEYIESLSGVPEMVKHQLAAHLCRSRKMGSHVLGLLVSDSPTEIHLTDCSWGTEADFQEAFGRCNTENLKVIELNISGRCLPDYLLQGVLAKSPNSLPLLTKISLKGNYRLSDDGLKAIVASAPMLSSVNLSQCSLITSAGIIALACKSELSLKELYIDDCHDVDTMSILPALMKLKHLEVLSVAGIETVSNKFVRKLVSVCGSKMKELILSGCRKLTDPSVKAIGENCPELCYLDLRKVNRLTDSALGHLANGCRTIQKLQFRQNSFSDEAVAAFLETSGGSVNELSLNNVEKVGQQTAIAISRQCPSTLKSLDLSFCRNLTDEALGLIVDSCSFLRILKLFGCTQITELFLEGHSNTTVKIIGLNGAVLDQIDIPVFL